MEENQQLEAVFIIQDLETLRIISDPLRTQIFELLIQSPLSVKQVADRLGLAPGKLYYHFSQLEKVGLIRVVETRMHANLVEKIYQAAAATLSIDKNLLNFASSSGQENIFSLAVSAIDTTREDILRSFQVRATQLEQGATGQPRKAIIQRALSRISDERAEEFTERLHALILEFSQSDAPASDGAEKRQAYALSVFFYPSFYYEEVEAGTK